MNFWTSLLHNFPLVCAGTGWIVAQIIKVFTGVFKLRKFSIVALLFGNGGMPSSHSASVTALAISCGLCYGFDSGFFAIALMFAIIVMGDAAGVRRETGEQAKILNRIARKEIFTNTENGSRSRNHVLGSLKADSQFLLQSLVCRFELGNSGQESGDIWL